MCVLRAALLLSAIWGAWAAWTALSVRSDVSDARHDLRALRAELDAESLLEGQGIEELERPPSGSTRSATGSSSPFLAPLRWLPVAGRQLSAATHQVDAAATGLQAAADLGGELEVLVDRGLGSGPGASRHPPRGGRDR